MTVEVLHQLVDVDRLLTVEAHLLLDEEDLPRQMTVIVEARRADVEGRHRPLLLGLRGRKTEIGAMNLVVQGKLIIAFILTDLLLGREKIDQDGKRSDLFMLPSNWIRTKQQEQEKNSE